MNHFTTTLKHFTTTSWHAGQYLL